MKSKGKKAAARRARPSAARATERPVLRRKNLILDQVKIDAIFLHDAGRGGHSDAIVRSLVELAHRLGLETVAEGVESRLAWEAAAELGCDFAQGFYLGHPMPADRLSDWLAGTWPVVAVAT